MGGAFNVGSITGQMGLDLSGWTAPVRQAQQDTRQLTQGLRDVGQQTQQLGRQMQQVGGQLTRSITTPIVAATAAVTAAGVQHENAMVAIRRATGATTDQMAEFEDIFRRVFTTVPESAQDVAAVIGELNTRMEITGDALGIMTTRVLEFARVNETDAIPTARLMGQFYNAFNLELRDNIRLMDMATVAAQRVGIGAREVLDFAFRSGTAFAELGFELERSIALFAQFERVGARPEELLGSLRIAITSLAREGFTDANEAFSELLRRIEEAPSILAATAIAAEAFGSRVASQIATNVRLGLFEVDEMVESLSNAEGALASMAAETLTFADSLRVMRNQISNALEPLGTLVTTMFQGFARSAEPALRTLRSLGEIIAELPTPILAATAAFVGMAAVLGPILLTGGALVTLLGGAMLISLGKVALVVAGVTAAVVAGATAWVQYREEIINTLDSMDSRFARTLSSMLSRISSFFGALKQTVDLSVGIITSNSERILGAFDPDSTVDGGFDSAALEFMREQAREAQEHIDAVGQSSRDAAGGIDDLTAAGQRLVRQLFPLQDLVLTVRENLAELAAVGRTDAGARRALGELLTQRFQDVPLDELDRVIEAARQVDEVVADAFREERAARIQNFYDNLFPGQRVLDQILDQLPALRGAMGEYENAFEVFAQNVAVQLRGLGDDAAANIVAGLEQAKPELSNAVLDIVNDMFEAERFAEGQGLFNRLIGAEEMGRIQGDLVALEAFVRDAVEAGRIDDDTAHLLGTALWQQLGDSALTMLRQLADEIPTLKELFGETFEELAQEQEDLARAEGLRDLAHDIQGIGFAIGQLGPNFRQAAQAAQVASRVMRVAAAAVNPGWALVQESLMLIVETLGLISSETEKTKSAFDELLGELDQALDEWGRRFVDTMIDALKTGEFAFNDFVESVLEDLARIGMQTLIVDPITSAIRGAFAQGAVFEGGNVVPFAKGGLIDRPTIFPMAKGMGLAGEAGPEAIFPLTRLPGGDLGLKGSGGAQVNIEVIDQRSGGAEIERQEMQGPDGSQIVRLIVRDEVRRGIDEGNFDDSLSRSFALRRRGIAR